jgi:hypothetical protein
MAATPPPATARPEAPFGAGRLFLADSRLAFAVANHLRHQALHRVFGVSRQQANLVTLAVALTAADAAYETTRRVFKTRLHVSGTNAAAGAIGLRATALGLVGPANRDVPGLGTLLTVAMLGGLAAPGVRAIRRLRATEQRVRLERIRRYTAAPN